MRLRDRIWLIATGIFMFVALFIGSVGIELSPKVKEVLSGLLTLMLVGSIGIIYANRIRASNARPNNDA